VILRVVVACLGLRALSEPLVAVGADDARDSVRRPPVPIERLEVSPDPEDRPAPTKDRWVRFAEALGPGRSAGRSETSGTDASGVRYSCYSPCFINCCVRGPDPAAAVAGRNAGR